MKQEMTGNPYKLKLETNLSMIKQPVNKELLKRILWVTSFLLVFAIGLVGMYRADMFSLSFSAQNIRLQPYSPFKPEPNFQAAIKLLPLNKNLAEEKLIELEKSLSPSNDARRLYILAQINQRAGKVKEAYEQYLAIKPALIPLLADRVLLHRAETAAELGFEKVVMDSCRNILNHHPNSLSVSAAHYELARSYLRQSDFAEAIKIFNKVRTNYPQSQQSLGAAFYLGQMSKNLNERNQYWEEYLAHSPDGRFAADIVAAWQKDVNSLNARQKSLLGLTRLKGEEAVSTDTLALLASDLNEFNWYALAQAQLEAKQQQAAQQTLLQALKRFPQSDDFRDGYNLLMRNSSVQDRETFTESLLPSAAAEDKAYMLWRLASFNTNKRKEILQRLRVQYPDSVWSAPASAEIFWEYYKAGQMQVALELAQEHLAKHSNKPESAKVLFWMGKKAESDGDLQKAKTHYAELIRLHESNYYAFRALGRLKAINGGNDPGWFLPSDFQLATTALNKHDPAQTNWVWPLPQAEVKQLHPTLQELFALNLWQEAVSLMPSKYEKQFPALRAWIMARIEEKVADAINLSSRQLSKRKSKFSTDHDYWQLSYPLVYFSYSVNAGSKYQVNPLLLQGLMRQESRFQHKVVSRSKAVGLCQLMPGTAKEVAKSISYPTPDFDMLCNPEYNIELGSKYLSGLLKQFEGKSHLAVAAYNAGPGAVSKWLKANPNTDPDWFIESIPYQETQKYVVNVFENYWVYKNLLERQLKDTKTDWHPTSTQDISSEQSFGLDYPSTTSAN